MAQHTQFVRALVLALLIAPAFGCSTTPDKPSLMANMANEDATVYQLRAMDYEYASQFAQLVAAAVLDIAAASEDSAIVDAAYQWRMWAMPQARAAAFDQDPFAGLVELWVLAEQQHRYFLDGGGKGSFGAQQDRALSTTQHLVEEVEILASNVMSENSFAKLDETVSDWAAKHPIEGQLYVRPTARADLASLVSEEKHGGLKAVGSMEETLRDLSDRVTILSLQTPLEVRWQAEYLVQSLFEDEVHGRIDSMVGSMASMTRVANSFEETLSTQTSALLSGIEQERITVFDAIEDERDAILEAIDGQRDTITGHIQTQLDTTTAKLDTVGRGLIDHFFARLIQVLVVMGIVGFLTVLLVLLVLRRRGSGND